jgi:hypothetical protein
VIYRPVKVVQILAVEYRKATKPWEQFAVGRPDGIPSTMQRHGTLHVHTGRERRYWQVRSNLLGTCGHKHRTEEAASPCLRRMKVKDSELRSKRSRLAHRRRKLAAPGIVTTEAEYRGLGFPAN